MIHHRGHAQRGVERVHARVGRADLVVLQPLRPGEAALAGATLGLGEGQEWLTKIRADMVGMVNRRTVRFALLSPTPLELTCAVKCAGQWLATGAPLALAAPIAAMGLGAPLARVEGEIAFSTLVRRFPGLHLETEDIAWQPSVVFRGPKQLPIILS